jgi:hypothetical protein
VELALGQVGRMRDLIDAMNRCQRDGDRPQTDAMDRFASEISDLRDEADTFACDVKPYVCDDDPATDDC